MPPGPTGVFYCVLPRPAGIVMNNKDKEKMSAKRLFLFAGYDRAGIVDPSLIYYIRALSKLGDVILCMDCDCATTELAKVAPYTIHASATRHGEYDFGSYKRAYIWAAQNLNLADYDFVYLVNDSVYGPLRPLGPVLENLETKNLDAFGLVCNPHPDHPHIQSWFIGCRRSVFLSDWFDTFIRAIKKLESKGLITRMYEHGFTASVVANGRTWGCLMTVRNRGVYNRVRGLYRRGLPFIKKVAFSRHGGAYGRQIYYVLHDADAEARNAILAGATHTWGAEYINWLLTKNPVKVLYRGIKNGLHKICSGTL